MSRPSVIAVVDDDEAVRDALLDLLQFEGLRAQGFGRAAAFLEAFRQFDCVISDIRMPQVDGIELQRRLRACCSAMPVIYVTSCDELALRACAIEEGAAGWFTKPVDDARLIERLKTVLPRC